MPLVRKYRVGYGRQIRSSRDRSTSTIARVIHCSIGLTQVCRRWRAIALRHPPLDFNYSWIDINLKVFIARSQNMLMDLESSISTSLLWMAYTIPYLTVLAPIATISAYCSQDSSESALSASPELGMLSLTSYIRSAVHNPSTAFT